MKLKTKDIIGIAFYSLIAAVVLVAWCEIRSDSPKSDEAPVRVTQPEIQTPAAPPADIEPVYTANSERAVGRSPAEVAKASAAENAATRAAYARCSQFAAFRMGSRVDGTYVPKRFGGPLVNVEIDLARPELASGNNLFYSVGLDDSGSPATIKPVKAISATMCGLEPDAETPL